MIISFSGFPCSYQRKALKLLELTMFFDSILSLTHCLRTPLPGNDCTYEICAVSIENKALPLSLSFISIGFFSPIFSLYACSKDIMSCDSGVSNEKSKCGNYAFYFEIHVHEASILFPAVFYSSFLGGKNEAKLSIVHFIFIDILTY